MTDFEDKFNSLVRRIMLHGEEVEVGEWQSQDVRDQPHMISRELRHEQFRLAVPRSVTGLQHEVKPNLPWAEDHFLERVSGLPLNPPPSEAWWPFARKQNAEHKEVDDEKFSHTYPERIWPRYANDYLENFGVDWGSDHDYEGYRGIRYRLGDLNDLVALLARNPQTRQAYLPIWFPEDTGAVQGQRVPCTIGYHFLCRNRVMDIVYYIRSCDLLRHFTDDVYMAARLLQWVVGKLGEHSVDLRAGTLIMQISSLHVFRGDYPRLEMMIANMEEDTQYGAAV